MKIAVLGAGNIGGTLGKKWLASGHEVMFGVRDRQSAKTQAALEATGGKIRAVEMGEALRFGEVVLLAIPHAAVPELLAAHAAGLANKILLDATNNFGGPVINSLATIQAQAPSAMRWAAKRLIGSGVSKLGMPCASETTPGMRLACSSTSLIGDSVRPRDGHRGSQKPHSMHLSTIACAGGTSTQSGGTSDSTSGSPTTKRARLSAIACPSSAMNAVGVMPITSGASEILVVLFFFAIMASTITSGPMISRIRASGSTSKGM